MQTIMAIFREIKIYKNFFPSKITPSRQTSIKRKVYLHFYSQDKRSNRINTSKGAQFTNKVYSERKVLKVALII